MRPSCQRREGEDTRRSVLLCHSHDVVVRVSHVDERGSVDISDGRIAARVLLCNHVCSEGISTFSRYIRAIA